MIKVEQYPVVFPEIYTEKIWANVRQDVSGDRHALTHSLYANNLSSITLPWIPPAPEWVEIYVNDIRLVNPRIHTADGRTFGQTAGTMYEKFNVYGNWVVFTDVVSGNISIVCDTLAAHWWGSKVIDCDNIQSVTNDILLSNVNLPVSSWPIAYADQKGFDNTIKFKPGPIFDISLDEITIAESLPNEFNSVIAGDPVESTPSLLTYTTSITDDFVADGISVDFDLTSFPSADNLVVKVNGAFVPKTEYTYGNVVANIANVDVTVSRVTFSNVAPSANANVSIFYIPYNASYRFLSMTTLGTISGVAKDFLSRRIESSLYSEPIVITPPRHGYARLTTDRKKLVYVPDVGFQGSDFFKWALITQHGQIGIPLCTEVVVQTL